MQLIVSGALWHRLPAAASPPSSEAAEYELALADELHDSGDSLVALAPETDAARNGHNGIVDIAVLSEAVRTVVRQELNASLAEIPSWEPTHSCKSASPPALNLDTTATGNPTESDAAITDETDWVDETIRMEMVDRTFALVDAAIETGRWTIEDTHQAMETARYLKEDERVRALEAINTAINSGQLDPSSVIHLPF
jgi:hypothetical protein